MACNAHAAYACGMAAAGAASNNSLARTDRSPIRMCTLDTQHVTFVRVTATIMHSIATCRDAMAMRDWTHVATWFDQERCEHASTRNKRARASVFSFARALRR